MEKKAIVTLTDSKYFDLVLELIESIKKFPKSKDIKICVLDAGMTDDQSLILKNKVYKVEKAKWDIEIPFYKKKAEWLKSQVSRAFIPNYFPEFDKYLWIDSDAWVNDWNCIDNYFKACDNNKLGITQTFGPGYKILGKVNWIFSKYAEIKSQNYKHAKLSGINEADARKLAFAPHINIGVFSLEKNSSCWDVWQKNLKTTLSHGQIFGSEQLAINICVYIDNVDVEFLPHNCNWLASNLLPKFDEKNKIFVEPFLPNHKIGIIHLASGIKVNDKDMRNEKNLEIELNTLDNNKISKSLRFKTN